MLLPIDSRSGVLRTLRGLLLNTKLGDKYCLFAALGLAASLAGYAAQAPAGANIPQAQKVPTPVLKKKVEATAASKGCYAVQVGAYEDRREAVATQNQLSRQFRNAMQMSQSPSEKKIFWRVRMLAASKQEAEALVRRLQKTQWNKAFVAPTPCT